MRELHVVVELLELGTAREHVLQEVLNVELQADPELYGADLPPKRSPQRPEELCVGDVVEDDVAQGGARPAADGEYEECVHPPEAECREVWKVDTGGVHVRGP